MRITFWGADREVTGSMHLLEAAGKRILLDCGLFQGRREEAHQKNSTFPLKASDVDAVVLSHAHIDHAGGVAELSQQLGLPIVGPHIADKFWIDSLAQQGKMFGLPHAEGFSPTRWLVDGDTVNVGNCSLSVRHCPGHTPGHVVFHSPESHRAFVGDVLFAGSIGRTDLPQGDHATLINSIQQRLWPMGDETGFSPGHGPESTFGQERHTNPYVGGS